ncbi:unnamed protein product [Closterium sp. NIES-65]|nr:unnamed protein product [Closterium sp. NIES-65]
MPEIDPDLDEKNPPALDEDDIALLKTYGLGPYSTSIKKVEKDIKDMAKKVNDLCGIKESDTGLAAPSQWDLVARCTKIINPNTDDAKYVINVKQIAKFVVGLGDRVSPTDIEEGMRVGVDRNKYQIQIPLPPKIDPSVTMMTVEEKPDVTYGDVGGCKEQIEKMRESVTMMTVEEKLDVAYGDVGGCKEQIEKMRGAWVRERVVELTMLHPEKFVKLGIDPPKGVLCYGPPSLTQACRATSQSQSPLFPSFPLFPTIFQVVELPVLHPENFVVELPMLHPEKFVKLGIDPPKGVLCYGPPGTGKTLLARAVANRTDACFIRVIGSELVQKYVGEGARMVRELFQMARSKKACIIFFDEVDAIGGARFDDGAGGDNEVQRTMLEIVNQLDGFDARGNIKVLMATNRCVEVCSGVNMCAATSRIGDLHCSAVDEGPGGVKEATTSKAEFVPPDFGGAQPHLINAPTLRTLSARLSLLPNPSPLISLFSPIPLRSSLSSPQSLSARLSLLPNPSPLVSLFSPIPLLKPSPGLSLFVLLSCIPGVWSARPDTLDPALLRPGRLDRKVEFGLPDLEGRTHIFKIHTRTMNCERDIRFELLARLCPNSTGADIRSVCTEAGMYAIRARRKTSHACSPSPCSPICPPPPTPSPLPRSRHLQCVHEGGHVCHEGMMHTGADIRSVCTEAGMYAIRARRKTVTEKDFLEAVNKVIKGYQKFSATPKYMVYN